MSKITDKIKEAVGAAENLSKFTKFSKLKASYIEYDKFADSNLHEGYFCYNCIYWISLGGGKCMLVEEKGPDVLGKVSDVIAPHGCCAGYEANYDKLRYEKIKWISESHRHPKDKDKLAERHIS